MKKQIFNRRDRLEMRRELRNNCTPHEALMWKLLKERQILGLKFRRQHSVGPFVLDFYCPSIRLCIELDGSVHHSMEAEYYDEDRTAYLRDECGIHVIRFDNDDIVNNPDGVRQEIERVAKELTQPNPLTPPNDSTPPNLL